MGDVTLYLKATETIDLDSEAMTRVVGQLVDRCVIDAERSKELFHFVRDSIPCNVYTISMFKEDFVASTVLDRGKGYCVQKAALLAALGQRGRHVAQTVVRSKWTDGG